MKWNSGGASRTIAKLLVRTTLPHFRETKLVQNGDNLSRLQDRDISHVSSDGDVLHPNELRLENWFAIFQEHGNDFSQVDVQFIKR